jgi:hypothetical protein
MPTSTSPLSEAELTHRLAAKYAEKSGNGNAYAFIPQVRNAAGFDANRTIDAYVMALWPSRGLTLTAFEIKSSRSDWVRELHKPEKAEAFCRLADFFYLVVGDKSIVHPGELPETWGLMVPHGKGLRAEVEAPALRDLSAKPRPLPPAFGRSYLAALLRAATYVGATTPEEIRAAEDRARESERERVEMDTGHWQRRAQAAENTLQEFQHAAHVSMGGNWSGSHHPAEVGRAVRAVLDGDKQLDRLADRVDGLRKQAQAVLTALNEVAPQEPQLALEPAF